MRLTTIGVNFFQHDGVAVGAGWSEFDYASADQDAKNSFREHAGRFFKIHPDDVGELAALGLALENGKVVDAAPAPEPAPPATAVVAPPAAPPAAEPPVAPANGKRRA